MRGRILDAGSVLALRPSAISAYLRTRGWTLVESTDQGTTWMSSDADVDVLLPPDRALRDFARRVSELLVTLGRVEERSELDVYRDLTMATADAIRIQVTGKGSEEGTIALDDGVSVIQHARNLLLAAACSTVEPRPLHPPASRLGRRSTCTAFDSDRRSAAASSRRCCLR